MASDSSTPSIESTQKEYSEHRKIRGYRSGCGFVTATWGLVCPRCGQRDLEPADLGGSGVIVAFTVQTVPSDEYLSEVPYAYVVVELDGGGRVTGWIPGISSESQLGPGRRVRLQPPTRPGLQFAVETNDPAAGRS